jgi:hypothetical protein
MTDKLAELEAQHLALGAEIAKLRAAQPAPAPRPPRDERSVSVVSIFDERTDGMPTLKELQRLFEIVRPRAPWPLNDKYDESKPFRGFCSSFRWLANKGRIEQPNPKFALSFWLDNCRTWLRDRNSMAGDVDANSLILATYASGDIKFLPANPVLGHLWEIGISEYSGRPASPDSWKRILREGASAILPPSAPARRMPPPSNVRIFGGY